MELYSKTTIQIACARVAADAKNGQVDVSDLQNMLEHQRASLLMLQMNATDDRHMAKAEQPIDYDKLLRNLMSVVIHADMKRGAWARKGINAIIKAKTGIQL